MALRMIWGVISTEKTRQPGDKREYFPSSFLLVFVRNMSFFFFTRFIYMVRILSSCGFLISFVLRLAGCIWCQWYLVIKIDISEQFHQRARKVMREWAVWDRFTTFGAPRVASFFLLSKVPLDAKIPPINTHAKSFDHEAYREKSWVFCRSGRAHYVFSRHSLCWVLEHL